MALSVLKGETVALVGESGCGKSTVFHLLQRFYDCDSGKVFIDGQDLKSYNLNCLRNYMGIVCQEPVLFATTIGENIRLGAKWKDEVTQERIEQAAKQANCYDFICQLPQGFDTPVGDRGVQLSGGQKQRIAIARALVRDPAILLLDEATSALDTQSESVVQEALYRASRGRTTLVIAHKLSTVKFADRIFLLQDGKVHEEGTHSYLLSQKGVYYSLVMRQLQQEKEEHFRKPRSKERVNYETERLLGKSDSHSSSIASCKLLQPTPVQESSKEISAKMSKQISQLTQPNISIIDIVRMNQPEMSLIAVGIVAAIINGTANVLFAILLSNAVGELSEPDLLLQERRVNMMALYTVLAAILTGLASIIQHYTLTLSGEKLVDRLRRESFSSLIKQEMTFFDQPENGEGLITNRLLSDTSLVKGATGMRLGILSQAYTTIIGGLIVAFSHVWELALVSLFFTPIMIASGTVQERFLRGNTYKNQVNLEEGVQMAQEAISNIRTVTSLNRQRYFTDNFHQRLKAFYQAEIKKIFTSGITYSLAQSAQFFMYAVCYGFGGYLIICGCLTWRSEKIPFHYILRIFAAVIFGSTAAGRALAQLPDLYKSKSAAFNIRKILAFKSLIDPYSEKGAILNTVRGHVEFNQVEFSYPTREGVKVLQKTTFSVESGETLALVGASGCGKSTSISLLERFYDSVSGQVAIDGEDVKGLNIQWLRHQLGMVSQEPTLFDMTIRENIAYGDNRREVAIDEIIEAARKANAHGFITSLPKGYETNVGAKGTQLSGGQKQRIAIARALVRNPAILLLDEATSALDAESEKIVQEALERAMAGRTTIIIAHRLSTIKNANKIGVIEDGRIVEMGSHEELIEKKGCYYNLIQAQLCEC
ncbi:phosphatidylcholine translocator ABCB4-like [Watersipora subatra]|uniref:phosphatidylcholine translocator ABCB4-like n=1 Tax=Watersipora subatra TaxID=2589382 RepID=UPI00355C6836